MRVRFLPELFLHAVPASLILNVGVSYAEPQAVMNAQEVSWYTVTDEYESIALDAVRGELIWM